MNNVKVIKETSSHGVGAPFLLFLVFLSLKLTGHITWSWLWVTAPLWFIPVSLIGVFVFAVLVTSFFDRR